MKPLAKTLLFILIAWCLVAGLIFLALPLLLWYLIKNDSYELIILAILIDGYYQAFYSVPVLSIWATILVGTSNLIKPQLLMYTGQNEVVS